MPEQKPEHSPIGGSSAYRWLACAASPRLSAGVEDKPSEYAALGTAVHEVAADCLKDDQDAWEHAGRVVEADGFKFEMGEEETENIQVYLDCIRSDITFYEKEALEHEDFEKPVVYIEHKFHLKDVDEDLYGTADCAIYFPGWNKLKIYDYKNGIGVLVDVEGNEQLRYYAAGVVNDLSGDHHIDRIGYTIIQPRRDHEDGPVRRWQEGIDELGEWVGSVLEPGVRATRDPQADAVPGDHCQFCPAKAICPALNELAKEVDKLAGDGIDYKVKPVEMEDWELGEWVLKVGVLKKYLAALEDEAFTRLMHGKPVPGAKLVRKKSNRVWKDGAADDLKKTYGDDAYVRQLRSPAQVDKLKNGKDFTKEHAYKPDTGLTIATESDKRAAVPLRSAAEAFADI